MNIIDLIKSLLGLGGNSGGKGGNLAFDAIGMLLKNSGGLKGLIEKFTQNGQGAAAASWVGLDKNQEIGGHDLEAAVGGDQLSQIAAKFGIDKSALSGRLAELLPKVVDKLTPTGQVPDDSVVSKALEALRTQFGKQ